MPTLIIPRKRDSYYISVLSGAIGSAFSGISVYKAMQNPQPFTTGNYVSIFFFVLCTVLVADALRKVLIKQAALTLTDEGLTDSISIGGIGFMPWNNVSGTEIKDYKGARHILVYLKDATPYINESGTVRQRIAYKMYNDIGTPLAINVQLIKYQPSELVKQIEQLKK